MNRIQQEAEIWASVTGHPNVVSFVETVPHNDKQDEALRYGTAAEMRAALQEAFAFSDPSESTSRRPPL